LNKNLIYLTQTQTTVGFLSGSSENLSLAKKRSISQKILQEVDSFKTLKQFTRIPNKYKKHIRNSKNTTYIYPNGESYRVVDPNSKHALFLNKFTSMYSTSANQTGCDFEFNYAFEMANVIVETKDGFSQNKPSSIYLLTSESKKRIR
jgi:tRNA A37 threonylcarbamoyladenosine synthetase subunit TsaC/SUA5/YrdC